MLIFLQPDPAALEKVPSFFQDIILFKLFEVNQTPVTVLSLLLFTGMLLLFYVASRFFRRILLSKIVGRANIDEGLRSSISRIVHYVVMIIGVLVAFQFVGIDFSGLAVIFGFLSVGIGFGLQNVTSNFISGLILLFERPIAVGDRVTVNDLVGDVLEINIRSTTIRTLDNISIIVPNNEFVSSTVTNWSHGDPRVRLNINVGVSYNSDLDAVIRALQEVAKENSQVLKTPKPQVHLREFGDSSWNMQLRAWLSGPENFEPVRNELNCAIVRKFKAFGIEIPFPQRDLHLRSGLQGLTSIAKEPA
ncbi:MAG: mechanosensitive ion channel family protein [Calditrichia bacterium]